MTLLEEIINLSKINLSNDKKFELDMAKYLDDIIYIIDNSDDKRGEMQLQFGRVIWNKSKRTATLIYELKSNEGILFSLKGKSTEDIKKQVLEKIKR